MDPISAAGVGLAVTGLVLQVFSGCIKGYQLFAEMKGMPAAYQHIRVRLYIEQTRLLRWGEKCGLVEEVLDQPSRVLQLNRNMIVDTLLEIQTVLKSCIVIKEKYEQVAQQKSVDSAGSERAFQNRFPKAGNTLLLKTLSILEKTTQLPKRLQWAMVKQDQFESLIHKLIAYNDSIEGLLDKTTMADLQASQFQTNLAMLQLNSKVDQLMEISLAMKISSQQSVVVSEDPLSQSTSPLSGQNEANLDLARLADFKAIDLRLEVQGIRDKLMPIDSKAVKLTTRSNAIRSEAIYKGKAVWIEWKEQTLDRDEQSHLDHVVRHRVQKLATLLSSHHKPPQFRAPLCLGYFENPKDRLPGYGFVYEKPPGVSSSTVPVSLLDLIGSEKRPSLTKRINLALTIARCLMYLHSVNWLHKGFRSSNIVFFPSGPVLDYAAPIMAGFDYARPDLQGELTEPPPEYSENDLYRHPSTIGHERQRSSKSHDIYSLGIVLIEIAFWQRVERTLGLPIGEKASRAFIRGIRRCLLEEPYLTELEGLVGETYRRVVQKCLHGGSSLGLSEDADENDQAVGAAIQGIFSEEIIDKLAGMKL